MNWKIVFVLLAVSLLLAGCAKGGRAGTNETAVGGTSGGTTTGAGETGTGGTGAGSGTSGGTSGASGDVGNLFQIDTDEPLEGSGYEVPTVEE